MIKLSLVIASMLLFSLGIFANSGVDCVTQDSRCSAYELEVNAEVIPAVVFEQVRPLNFGQVTRGENINVQYMGNSRGKQPGILRITVGTGDYEVYVLPELSKVNIETDDGIINKTVEDAYLSEEGETLDLPWMNGKGLGPRTFNILIRSSVNIPQNAKAGHITGSMRVQVIYL